MWTASIPRMSKHRFPSTVHSILICNKMLERHVTNLTNMEKVFRIFSINKCMLLTAALGVDVPSVFS